MPSAIAPSLSFPDTQYASSHEALAVIQRGLQLRPSAPKHFSNSMAAATTFDSYSLLGTWRLSKSINVAAWVSYGSAMGQSSDSDGVSRSGDRIVESDSGFNSGEFRYIKSKNVCSRSMSRGVCHHWCQLKPGVETKSLPHLWNEDKITWESCFSCDSIFERCIINFGIL